MPNNKNPRWLRVISQPFDENSYLVFRDGSTECVVIDPGFEPEAILEVLRAEGLTPVAILNTHGHSDHIAGNLALKEWFPTIPLVIGREDAEKLEDPDKNLSAPFGFRLVSPPADRVVGEGDVLEFAGLRFEVLETPGHSRGHVVFVIREASPILVFGGDVLFRGSIGRTDFPDGDFDDLVASIHNKLFPLPDDTQVLSGHGPETTIGLERGSNPFVGTRARDWER